MKFGNYSILGHRLDCTINVREIRVERDRTELCINPYTQSCKKKDCFCAKTFFRGQWKLWVKRSDFGRRLFFRDQKITRVKKDPISCNACANKKKSFWD